MGKITKEKYEEYLQSVHWEEFSRVIRRDRWKCEKCGIEDLLCHLCHMSEHGMGDWVKFCSKFSMDDIRRIPLYCENCTKPTGEYVFNFDEIVASLCWECKQG